MTKNDEFIVDKNEIYTITLRKISDNPERYVIVKVGTDWEKNEIDMRIVLDKKDITGIWNKIK